MGLGDLLRVATLCISMRIVKFQVTSSSYDGVSVV